MRAQKKEPENPGPNWIREFKFQSYDVIGLGFNK